jgi:hypothetical protein
VFVGGLITWWVSWRYYRKAGKDLAIETASLRRLNEIILHAMEDAGMVKLNLDGSFKIIGRVIEARAVFESRSTLLGEGDVIQPLDSPVN